MGTPSTPERPARPAGATRGRSPAGSERPSLHGRDVELAALSDMLDRAQARIGGACIVRGEAGIGKTALLEAVAERARERAMTVLWTRGVQSEAHLPFAGLHQVLSPFLPRIDQLGEVQRMSLRAAFGLEDSGTTGPFGIALAALELLTDVASGPPMLLVADDAQLLDAPTVDVLTFVARRLAADPIVALFGVRGEAIDGAGLDELRLAPLGGAASKAIVREHAPDLPAGRRERVLREAAGNPLALVELPATMGAIDDDAGLLPDLLPLTDRLEQTFAARVIELPEPTRLLLLAAAIDPGCALELLLAATGAVVGRPLTVEAIDPAAEARLVKVDAAGHVQFRHPLIASAIHQGASIADRVNVHTALADALDILPDRQVWHRAAAAVGMDEPLSCELERSAARALQRGAPAMAVSRLRRAAELTVDPMRRSALLLRAAELAGELGHRTAAADLVRLADTADLGPVERARLLGVGEVVAPGDLLDAGRIRSLIAAARGALAAGERDVAVDVLWRAASRCFWGGAADATGEPIVAGLGAAGLSPDDPRRLAILAYAQPVSYGAEVLRRLAERTPDRTDTMEMRFLGSTALVLGDFPASTSYLASAAAAYRAEGRLGLLARVLATRAWGNIWIGGWDQVLADLEESSRLAAETGEHLWAITATTGAAMLAALRGDGETAERLAVEAQGSPLLAGVRFILVATQHTRGVAALLGGRADQAFDHLVRMFEPTDPTYHPSMSTWGLSDLADAALLAGRTDAARAVLDGIEPRAARLPSPVLQLNVRYARAVLADGDAAEQLFGAALAADLSAWPLDHSRLLLAHGRWLRRQRRNADARRPLRAARDGFDALGATSWGERAREELRATGEASRRPAEHARDQLTPQELQIATMAARGMTNREIAQHLYLSHRTIGSHLYRVFPKLEITARSQLAEVLPGDG
jgi:DNA-binding CsgD family transcriptional regulator